MRIALAGIPALLLLTHPAAARPITAGVSLGLAQSKLDENADPNHTLGLFGRLGLTSRLSGQLEFSRYETDGNATADLRTGTALLVVDLADHSHFVPVLLGGFGFDREHTGCPICTFEGTNSGHHIEGGFGLEYRADGGLTLGADARLGDRTIDPQAVPLGGANVIAFVPQRLSGGEYRSLRLTLGIRF